MSTDVLSRETLYAEAGRMFQRKKLMSFALPAVILAYLAYVSLVAGPIWTM